MGVGSIGAFKPLDHIIKPVVKGILWLMMDVFRWSRTTTAIVLAVVSVVLLLVVLAGITKVLRGYVVGKLEGVFDRFLFRNALVAYLLGMMVTAMVQSSSVTTSLVVPLIGAGLLTIEQIYPYTLGANVGTTITAFLASLAYMSTNTAGFTIALVHFLFNVHGAVLFYPLRAVPIGMARWYARLAARRTRYALYFILGVFFLLPVAVIVVSRLW